MLNPIINNLPKLNYKIRSTKDLITKEVLERVKMKMKLSKKTNAPLLYDNNYELEAKNYISLCINVGMTRQAELFMVNCLIKRNENGLREYSLAFYNDLLLTWSIMGNFEAVSKLMQKIRTSDLKPDLNTFANIFLCISKNMNDEGKLNYAMGLITDMKSMDLNINDIFHQTLLDNDQVSLVTKVINKVIDNFNPNLSNNLLNFINQKSLDDEDIITKSCKIRIDENDIYKQIDIETLDSVIVPSILPSDSKSSQSIKARKLLEHHKKIWRINLKRSFLINFKQLESLMSVPTTFSILPYLKLWQADIYVDIMMQEIEYLCQQISSFSPSLNVLYHDLGRKINRKYIVTKRYKEDYVSKIINLYKNFVSRSYYKIPRLTFLNILQENDCLSLMSPRINWSDKTQIKIGRFLYDIIFSEIKVSSIKIGELNASKKSNKQIFPAFYTIFRNRGLIKCEEVVTHPFLNRLYSEAKFDEIHFLPNDLPMLVPPLPWITTNFGGYLLNTSDIVCNQRSDSCQNQFIKNFPQSQFSQMFDGLNAVSSCPWIINEPILDIVIDIFKKGGNLELKIPPKILHQNLTPNTGDVIDEMDSFISSAKIYKENKEMYSLWCTALYRLSIANKLRKQVFWLPHNVDFRGRAYPIPPHLNHLGDDLSRSLIKFAKGKKLGKDGLNWLKIHLINLTGFMKRNSNSQKLDYANSILELIFDSANFPMTGKLWWQKSDEPWQTLACCFEITSAINSKDEEHFISHLPVHQDGSCNGLQHYAALGRDEAGAKSVSLSPSMTPSDVYSDIVELIEIERKEDAANGYEIACILEGFVVRKVVKQSIMTTVYGVTMYGAKRQISNQLKDIKEFPEKHILHAADYLSRKTFNCIRKLFNSSENIQLWFLNCVEIVSSIQMNLIHWMTPIGWTPIQHYSRLQRITDAQKIQQRQITNRQKHQLKPNSRKQKTAFAPNFIHSLDASHMILTAIQCQKHDINFVAVHDSYWTHAADIVKMGNICREQFICLHEQPILEEFALHLFKHFGYDKSNSSKNCIIINKLLLAVPAKGNFNLAEVLHSTYFFS